MAFFDKREIVDLIRHEIRLGDDTGIASRVIRPSTKRSKYGGLPLNFRISDSDEDDEEMDDFYTIPLYEDTSSTRELIATRLCSRTVNSDDKSRHNIVQYEENPSTDLFVARPLSTKTEVFESLVSQSIQIGLEKAQNPLSEYAIYQASETGPSKRILILFTNNEKEEIHRQTVSVLPTTRVFQLINFCHFKYFEATGKELPGALADYELYMAEEDEPVDTEFPEIDRSRFISEMDFNCLALVRRDIHQENDISNRRIIIYFPKGPQYSLLLPNPDLPFSWLIDEVLKIRDTKGEDRPNIEHIREYDLEPVDEFELKMDLSKPISSTVVNEFVMIRKNSSRAGYHPRPETSPHPLVLERLLSLNLMSPMTPGLVPMTPGLTSHRESRHFEFPEDLSPPQDRSEQKEVVSCFRVERLHKLKPKWTANLLFYWDGLEISPFASDSERRKSFLPQQYQKIIKIPWEHLVDVKASEKEKSTKGLHIFPLEEKKIPEIVYLLSITWLPLPAGVEFKVDLNLQNIVQDFVGMNWKTIQVECKSKEDASEILKAILSTIQVRDSAVQQTWKFSLEGQKRPVNAAEFAIIALQADTSSNGEFVEKKKGRFKQFARLTRVLLSSDRKSSVMSTGVNTTPLI